MNKILLIILFLTLSCSKELSRFSKVSFTDQLFEVKPFIADQNGNLYLTYKVRIVEENLQLRWIVDSRKHDDKLYYYFVGQLSYPEYENLVSLPIEKKFATLIKEGKAFWLNPDGTKTKLTVD